MNKTKNTLEEMLEQNEGLIKHVCNKFSNKLDLSQTGFTFDDLVSEATIGFIESCNKYREDSNLKFSAFIYNRMYYHLQNLIARKSNMIKFSSRTATIANMIKRYDTDENNNIKLSIKELSDKYSVSNEAIKLAINCFHFGKTESYNIAIDTELQTQKIDTIASYDDDSLFYLRDINLNKRELDIARLLSQSYTYSDIARELKVSREYIRQCANKIKVKLERYYQNA